MIKRTTMLLVDRFIVPEINIPNKTNTEIYKKELRVYKAIAMYSRNSTTKVLLTVPMSMLINKPKTTGMAMVSMALRYLANKI